MITYWVEGKDQPATDSTQTLLTATNVVLNGDPDKPASSPREQLSVSDINEEVNRKVSLPGRLLCCGTNCVLLARHWIEGLVGEATRALSNLFAVVCMNYS